MLAAAVAPAGAWAQDTAALPTARQDGPPAATDAAAGTTQDGNQVADIVVTAQKRSENLQRVPIVITAVSGAELATAGVTSLPNIGTIAPGLNARTTAGGVFQPSIRGIGTSSNVVENPVALYIDGVYLPNQREGNRELPDVEQIAVLKGPQGTLVRAQRDRRGDSDHHPAPVAATDLRRQGGDRQLRDIPWQRLCFGRAEQPPFRQVCQSILPSRAGAGART